MEKRFCQKQNTAESSRGELRIKWQTRIILSMCLAVNSQWKRKEFKLTSDKGYLLNPGKNYGEPSNTTIEFLPKFNGNVHFYKKVYILFILDISVDLT